MEIELPKLQALSEGIQRSGKTADAPTAGSGEMIKKTGPFAVYLRVRGGKKFYDFIETAAKLKHPGNPMVYTYAPDSGNLTMGAGSLWSRQEILTASPAAQKAGKMAAIKDDLDAAIKHAVAHYQKYTPRD